MGSFLVFNQIGFFPFAAQNFYLIGSPTFLKSSIILGNGKTFSVLAENSSPANVYIAKTLWNGKPYQRSWFTHDQLMTRRTQAHYDR
jgi:putative alpha-1,2-mannosidase